MRWPPTTPTPSARLLDRLGAEVDLAVADVRRVIDDLRPADLDDGSLDLAVRRRAAAIAPVVAVDVQVGVLPDLRPEVETAAYRITSEALTNVARHAGAHHAQVAVAVADGSLTVRVADDGTGIAGPAGTGGIGLDSMRRRAHEPRGNPAGRLHPAGHRGHRQAAAMTTETTGPDRGAGALARVRVVVADDHPMFRFGLVAALAGAPDIEVVGEAGDGAELLTVVARTDPDVVLTDLSMPRMDGATATARIRATHPAVAVVVLTMHDDDEAVFAAMRAGANGYLLKGADRDDIVRAVLAVARGDAVYGPTVARRIVDFFTGTSRTYAAQVFPELTDREREVLDLIAAGHGNHEVARRLVLSEKTVRNHVSAILTKLQLTDRATAIVTARDAGLGRTQ